MEYVFVCVCAFEYTNTHTIFLYTSIEKSKNTQNKKKSEYKKKIIKIDCRERLLDNLCGRSGRKRDGGQKYEMKESSGRKGDLSTMLLVFHQRHFGNICFFVIIKTFKRTQTRYPCCILTIK